MKRILRSLIDISDNHGYPTIPPADLRRNFLAIRDGNFKFDADEDQKIYKYVEAYFFQGKDCPNVRSVVDHFTEQGNQQLVIDRLTEVESAKFYTRADFVNLVRGIVEKQRVEQCRDLITTAAEILHTGVEFKSKKGTLTKKGLKDAIIHFIKGSDKLLSPELSDVKLRGNIREDREFIQRSYEQMKSDPSRGSGKFTGLTNIDTVCRGNRKGQLWIHAGFTGEFKTGFALNWAYNNCVRYGWNTYYVSLEMPYEQLCRMIWCLHSANKKFLNAGYPVIPYQKVRDGMLSPEQEDHFFNRVVPDFEQNPDYGNFHVERFVEDLTIGEIKSRMELLHQQEPIHLAFIDHAGLVQPSVKSNEYTIALNSVVRDAKKVALNFNQGEGLPLVLLFQINRKGKKEAEDHDGNYNLMSLSYANEAERSGDVITYTYLDDVLKGNSEVKIGCLKNRDDPAFAQFKAKIIWDCRRLCNLEVGDLKSDAQNIELDVVKVLG